MVKPLHQKINKRILRLEFAKIVSPAFILDGDTQARFNPRAFYESISASKLRMGITMRQSLGLNWNLIFSSYWMGARCVL